MYQMLIDGELVNGSATLGVVNPATGRVFAHAARADRDQLEKAVAAAKRAFPAWSAKDYAQRRSYIERLADALEARAMDFATLLTQEQGKPLREAQDEVTGAIHALRHFATSELPAIVLAETAAERVTEHRVPLGVTVAITPWNFPLVLMAAKLAPALITGNVVIGKPAPTTPLTTLLLGELAAEIMPAGVFQTIVDDNDLGSILTSHPDVAYINFTGSTVTGKKILASAAERLKRFTLELGGNDAAIVLDDVDVEQVAPKLLQAAMGNAGQVCLAAKRLYVHESLYDPMCAALARLAKDMVVGDGLRQETQMGPVQNRRQYEKVLKYLEEARQKSTVLSGGYPMDGDGFFVPPTIVRDISPDTQLVAEEQFGPILPVLSYADIDAVVAMANDTPYGLGGSVWGTDIQRATAVALRIDSGVVWVNRHLILPYDVPFGGAKQSGIGRQHGLHSLHEVTQLKVVSVAL